MTGSIFGRYHAPTERQGASGKHADALALGERPMVGTGGLSSSLGRPLPLKRRPTLSSATALSASCGIKLMLGIFSSP
ncbi:MAG: hypothetical protein JO283_17470 [Bradyrhizobium sp.]|nr:hypothetical protein [Bradyrhizobium sp.]